ncbi:MOSC domain-containing protein [Naasia aerilata]|uniref:MOSC domain-containing protein n=1 Tax=Naasia aerilata TaxID=1162966 RepID=A0ABM8G8L0_9MICO|nr:molybdenum cofactor biosysynthesis protein [Naasia aerilata]BDZ44512.1 hypothetical protein GCM10025866_04210 [Naasia aerilata]
MAEQRVEIVELLASPVHRYEGRPADGPLPAEGSELVAGIDVRAGLGIVGDRYFGQRAHRDSSVSLQAAEALEAVAEDLSVPTPDLTSTRRNILLRGVDVDALAGTPFSLDSGEGEVVFRDSRPCRPCAWLDVTVGPGAHRAFRSRGGLRTGPVTDGRLRVGPAVLRTGEDVRLPRGGS